MYKADGSEECLEFWLEIEKARNRYRPSRTMNFCVDPSKGPDDFLMSLALVMETAKQYTPKMAKAG